MVKQFLGIDIGTNSVKIAELERQGKHARLANYVIADSPIKSKRENSGELKTSFLKIPDEALAALIVSMVERAKISARNVFIAVPIYTTFTTLIEVPKLSGEELTNAIQFEAKKHVPLPLTEVVLDWKPVGKPQKEKGAAPTAKDSNASASSLKVSAERTQRYLLMAVPQNIVDKYKHLVQLIKWDFEALEVETFSILRLVAALEEDEQGTILLDVGGRNTNVTAFSGQTIYWSANFAFSGEDLTRALMSGGVEVLGKLTFDQAEKVKRTRGLKDENVRRVLLPFIDAIMNKLGTVITNENTPDIKRVILAGGSARLPGLIEYIGQRFNIPASYIDPWQKISLSKELAQHSQALAASLSVATGIALRGINQSA